MHKSSTSTASQRSGGLLSKTGSLFGTRNAAARKASTQRSATSRPGTSGDSSTYLKDPAWQALDPFSPAEGPSGLRRTTSSRSAKDLKQDAAHGYRVRSPSIGTAVGEKLPQETAASAASNGAPNTTPLRHRSSLSSSSTRRKLSISRQRSVDSFNALLSKPTAANSSESASSGRAPAAASGNSMFAPTTQTVGVGTFGFGAHKTPEPGKPPGTSHSNVGFPAGGVGPGVPVTSAPNGVASPHVVYQHIHEMASKRISTLDYLRKAHEGRVYWFNTLLFTKQDLAKISYFDPKKLSRRATNYLLLGLSIPTILDLNSQNPFEYLRALNALLVEFENFQQVHPPDGTTTSSLSRARLPAMFKRATHSTGSKGRRASSATEIGLPMSSSDPGEMKSMVGGIGPASTNSSFPSNDPELLPGEEYTHLLTPSLPFDPDFYETFATLCDVLIDCYTRVMNLINSPATCTPGVGEMFTKADAKVRKVIVAGVVREFEDWSRTGVKSEIAGVGKVVLGGLT